MYVVKVKVLYKLANIHDKWHTFSNQKKKKIVTWNQYGISIEKLLPPISIGSSYKARHLMCCCVMNIFILATVDSFIFVGTNFHGFMKNDNFIGT